MDTPKSTPKGRENRKKAKRKRRQSGDPSSVSASGISTPRTEEPAKLKIHLGEKEEKGVANGSGAATKTTGSAAFGEEFIAFSFSDPPSDNDVDDDNEDRDQDASFRVDAKGKGRAREMNGGAGVEAHGSDDERERSRKRRRDRSEDRYGGRGDGGSSHLREWDKGKDRGGRRGRDDRVGLAKEYEMVFDFDTHKPQRFDPYTSKKAPWVAGIDWERCNNVAEMYVEPLHLNDGVFSFLCKKVTSGSRGLREVDITQSC